ncbi:MAG: hypothetical protein ACRCXB_08935 [Aeromonadaceae bacterium]
MMTIKNGDLPAMPLTGDAYTDLSGHIHKSYSYNPECLGMTKREEMAKDFLAAILASGTTRFTHDERISLAIKSADDLLNALDNIKGE